jgi:hypothetical protein
MRAYYERIALRYLSSEGQLKAASGQGHPANLVGLMVSGRPGETLGWSAHAAGSSAPKPAAATAVCLRPSFDCIDRCQPARTRPRPVYRWSICRPDRPSF